MRTDKQIKKEFLIHARKNPDAYYATEILNKHGYTRKECTACNKYFWSMHEHTVCGDSSCQGKISIFENNPSQKRLSYEQVWSTFKQHMHARGYAIISRYPVVARWNPTTDFTMASIAAFQPYTVSGEVEPPAKKLVIPQFCLRFGDIDNVGITGSHCTGFVMIGQKQFVQPEEWSQNDAFEDLFTYLTEELGLPKEEITLHEDAWAGGGNYGPCMEFFSRGVELCNQVYMLYEQTTQGAQELKLKVLDMGMGMERIAWFSQGAPTVYDAAFPQTLTRIRERIGMKFDSALYARFAPYGTLLNLDEVEDISAAWNEVARKTGIPVTELREKIQPMRAIYSIAEHARSLLFALTDGALPGNAGGYYNLRVIYRRAQQFIDTYNWNISLEEVAAWHAEELEGLYPELKKTIREIQELLRIEHQKYEENNIRGEEIIKKALTKDITIQKLIELYESNGVPPERVQQEAKKQGTRIDIPENFYALIRAQEQQETTQSTEKKHLLLTYTSQTAPLYYLSTNNIKSTSHVLEIHENAVVVDKTVFYPTGGGQECDLGTIQGQRVIDVYKQGSVIIHILEERPTFAVGDIVELSVQLERRIQLSQHHTAAHIINGATKELLGSHVWQAGAHKDVHKARLDITHYESLHDEQIQRIEERAKQIINEDKPVLVREMKKSVAEQEYGFRIYQGGAVPGNKIRIVEIPDFDIEACGGTHMHSTGEVQLIKILKTTKIQDGIVRIEFVAGTAAHNYVQQRNDILEECASLLGGEEKDVLARTEELFTKWKKVKKLRKKKQEIPQELTILEARGEKKGDILQQAAEVVSVQEEHLPKTLRRFLNDLEKRKEE